MTLFSLDTSTRTGSMALWRNGAAVGRAGADTRSHAERLPLEAVAFLADHGTTLADIDEFVVISGPGSFTGLRVGVAAVQGWAFAAGRQVAAVASLDALVVSLGAALPPGVIAVPCLDGLRGEVFYGAWRGETMLLDAAVGAPSLAVVEVRAVAGDAPVVVAGDGALRYAANWQAAGWQTVEPTMTLAEAAARVVAAGRVAAAPPHAARPNYVRRPDAEVVRERRAQRP